MGERRSARERETELLSRLNERRENEREKEEAAARLAPQEKKERNARELFRFSFFVFFVFDINVMSTIAKFFVDKHWKIAQVVLPTSMLFGFMYTMKHGEAPFDIWGSNTSVRGGVSTAAKDALPLHSVSMRFNWDTTQTKD